MLTVLHLFMFVYVCKQVHCIINWTIQMFIMFVDEDLLHVFYCLNTDMLPR